MSALLKVKERQQIRRINAALRDANRAEMAARLWRRKVLEVLAEGPATRYDLAVEICGRGTSPNAAQRNALDKAIGELIAAGQVRERPMIEPAGRAVRVVPVTVVELTGSGR